VTKPDLLRVLVAEDDPAVREALAELIAGEPTLELVGTAADATEAIAIASREHPDVVLVDVRMPGGGGVTAARGIVRHSPASKVIALSGQGDRTTVLQMLEAGVVGYLLKGGSVDEIIEAIKRAPADQSSLSIEVTRDVIRELAGQLTVRTRQQKKEHAVERRIRKALDDERALEMVFQPIIGLEKGDMVGAEALARFSARPLRPPNVWFAEAAVVGLRAELELAAIRKALDRLPEIPEPTYITVNVSPATLAKPEFIKLVSRAEPTRIVAEVTEHAPIDDYARVGGALSKLRKLGVRLAIDDAGAGYSSLRHILELSPDLIKLDISLIRDIGRDRSKEALAAGLISFAAKSGATIIAEGIESSEEARALVELGVAYGQGYFLCRPGPLPLPTSPAGRRKVGST
jgi:EAL domain-containing protein (putative c-di-GMP-specific phosphodiesterase class I)/DNA-binding NarL/FixJ family response regulator